MSRSLRLPSWLSPPSADVAIEIAPRRVTVAEISGGRPMVSGYASETLPPDAVVPALAAKNLAQPRVVVDAVKRALAAAGIKSPSRVALVLPDSVARVSLLPMEQIPSRQSELEGLIRWQAKKSLPFPVEDAVLSYMPAASDGRVTTMAAVLAHRAVVAEYEGVADALGAHAGVVDIASFDVINTVLAAGLAPDGDWLLVLLAADSTTLAIMRGSSLVFHRHRVASDSEPLGALVHQTAMYYEDRLGGAKFAAVFLSGGGSDAAHEQARAHIAERLDVPVQTLDARAAASLTDRITAGPDILEALAAPVGALLRDRGAA